MSMSLQCSSRAASIEDSESNGGSMSLQKATGRASQEQSPAGHANEASDNESSPGQNLKHQAETKQETSGKELSTERLFRRKKRNSQSLYSDILDDMISEVDADDDSDDPDSLQSSFIAGSYWTAAEKDALFRKLRITGVNDLSRLSQAVRSKSVVEIKAYLTLLESKAKALYNQETINGIENHIDIPASVEVSEAVEELLDKFAHEECCIDFYEDCDNECRNEGEDWIIQSSTIDNSSLPTPDSNLLCAATLLQLSENLFMNGPIEEEANWRCFIDPGAEIHSPAMFRSAYDEFHNLVRSMTQQLVRAAITQAEFRLRAKMDVGSQEVKAADVSVATGLLGLVPDRQRYWACLPRRCGVTVYTYSDRYEDGRTTTKNGVPLKYEEVEAELGLPMDEIVTQDGCASEERSGEDTGEHMRFRISDDSDNDNVQKWEDSNSDDDSAIMSVDGIDIKRESKFVSKKFGADSSEGDLGAKPLLLSQRQKRKGGFARHCRDSEAEDINEDLDDDQRLNFNDQSQSLEEEQRLMSLLLEHPPQLPVSAQPSHHRPRKKAKTGPVSMPSKSWSDPCWRGDLEYVAEWEQVSVAGRIDESRLPSFKLRDGRLRFVKPISSL